MKRLFSLMLLLTIVFTAKAQFKIVEDFEGSSKFNWSEYADKEMSTLIMGGYLELNKLSDDLAAIWCHTDLPINPELDFKITAKLLVPKIEEGEKFGVLIDRDEDFNKLAFLFEPEKFMAYQYNDGIDKTKGETIRIKLKEGKNQTIDLVIERKGGSYIISYNNMEVFRWRKPLNSPYFAFFTTSKLKVEEMTLEQ